MALVIGVEKERKLRTASCLNSLRQKKLQPLERSQFFECIYERINCGACCADEIRWAMKFPAQKEKQQISYIRLDPVNGGQEIECDGNYLSNYWRFGRDREWGRKKVLGRISLSWIDWRRCRCIQDRLWDRARCVTNCETFSRLKSSKHKAKEYKVSVSGFL